MNKEYITDYKARLEKGLAEFMELPVSERSAEAVKSMIECLNAVDHLEHCGYHAEALTHEDVMHWYSKMQNDDGTTGGHWTVDQTNAVAAALGVKFEHISEWCWNAAMNMMFSDYYNTAMKFGVATPEFFGELAKEFLFDKDGPDPKEKLSAYYHSIVARS